MTRLYADYALDINGLNLNRLISGYVDSQSSNNTYLTVGSYTYEDTLDVIYYSGGYFGALFGGNNFAFDSSGRLTSGIVTGYLQGFYSGSTPVAWWGIEGMTYSAADMFTATLTSSTKDDFQIISSILSGDDEFYLSDYSDFVFGYGGNDVIYGSAGADTLSGGAGDDTLDGGTGADRMTGGTGHDVYVVDDTKDVVTEKAGEGTDTIRTSLSSYSLASLTAVENLTYTGVDNATLTGNASVNTLTGSSGNDTLNGVAGADVMIGGSGNDTYIIDNAGDAITEIENGGVDSVQSSVSHTLSNNVENLTLTGKAAINGIGNSQNNTLTGNAAANTLDGGSGEDTLAGGAGNDTYLVDSTTDTITEATSGGTDTVRSSVNFSLIDISNVENLVYTGSSGWTGTGNTLNNAITGGIGNDSIMGSAGADTLSGGAGDDTLDGGTGADRMTGGTGHDVYVVDDTKDVVTEKAGEGTDTIRTSLSSYSLASLTAVENLTYTGAESNAATLVGNALANTLTSAGGNDRLTGGKGADTLVGGSGSDTFVFAAGDSGQASNYDITSDFSKGAAGTGDLIDYSASLTLGGNANAATDAEASVNQTTGIATFNTGSGTALGDALSDIAKRFTAAKDTAGEFALFKWGSDLDYYLFISDGRAGVTANDVVIELVGVQEISSINLTGGNLMILT